MFCVLAVIQYLGYGRYNNQTSDYTLTGLCKSYAFVVPQLISVLVACIFIYIGRKISLKIDHIILHASVEEQDRRGIIR